MKHFFPPYYRVSFPGSWAIISSIGLVNTSWIIQVLMHGVFTAINVLAELLFPPQSYFSEDWSLISDADMHMHRLISPLTSVWVVISILPALNMVISLLCFYLKPILWLKMYEKLFDWGPCDLRSTGYESMIIIYVSYGSHAV